MAQLFKCPALAHVMVSQLMGSSPPSLVGLCADSWVLGACFDSVTPLPPAASAPPPLVCVFSLARAKINIEKKTWTHGKTPNSVHLKNAKLGALGWLS